jgi:hypothetical protein
LNWDGYIALADNLAKRGSEVMDRTAVSRAYYGAFNLSRRWLEANGTRIDHHRAHRQVWDTFRVADRASAPTRDDWILVGNLGNSLRGFRNEVDYADLVLELDGRVIDAVEDARRILSLLPQLDVAD